MQLMDNTMTYEEILKNWELLIQNSQTLEELKTNAHTINHQAYDREKAGLSCSNLDLVGLLSKLHEREQAIAGTKSTNWIGSGIFYCVTEVGKMDRIPFI